jgi:hypothetical protein
MKWFSKLMLTTCALALSVTLALHVGAQEKAAAESSVSADEALAGSLKTWQELKMKCGGNYRYTVAFSSSAGFGNRTEILVRSNKVVERNYSEFNRNAPAPAPAPRPENAPNQKWSEKGDQLGMHNEGAPPKTLDELYQEAQKVLATKLTPTQRRYVKFDKQGLLELCFYIDTRIADDAPRTGVAIGAIELELPKQ